MSEFNFNSAICTSREQSERLLALGLKKETADMHHYRWSEGYWDIQVCPQRGESSSFIPAWSLHRLIQIACDNNRDNLKGDIDPEEVYNQIIECIEHEIKEGCFNKEYLV